MYEENNNEGKFTITLEGVLDRNATKNNLEKELLSLKKENFFKQISLSSKSSKDFLSLGFERLRSLEKLKSFEKLKSLENPKSNNFQKLVSFKSLNFLKSSPLNDHFSALRENALKGVFKNLDFLKDKISLSWNGWDAKSSGSNFYLKPELDKLDLNSSKQYSYFKTENIKNAFRQNFIQNSNKGQTNATLKDFRLNSNSDKIQHSFDKIDLQEPLLKNENNHTIWGNLISSRKILKDSVLVNFFKIKNGFDDFKSSLKEFQNLKDKKITQLSLENFICKDNQIDSASKILKEQRPFETELERNDFLRKLYVLQGLQNSNLNSDLNSNFNDLSFMVEFVEKLKNEGYAKNDLKAISLISDFLGGENNLENVFKSNPSVSLKNLHPKGDPEFLNSSKIINGVYEPKLDSLLEKTVELLEWAKSYDFTSSVLDPLRNTFSNFGNLLGQTLESLPLVEYMTNLLRDCGGGLNSRGIDDDSRMP
ncbi:hypothetical protein QIA41_04745 (plasmid) [Borreliella sinica]|uniref:hypothetical protein n=1 Tax=Borreliella sinica TaxID=87162 RepID=UPI002A23BA91|nr:hypothetical protein [Borreliella sinica]WPM06404.1 hypothetical protein QIA41_04745 [Borreliella sinica]